MSEKVNFHQTVKSGIDQAAENLLIQGDQPNVFDSDSVEIDGIRHEVEVQKNDGTGYAAVSLEGSHHLHPQESHTLATVEQQSPERSRATVLTEQGTYKTAEPGTTTVERPGYGKIEIRNPRAKELVAKLAARSIRHTQQAAKDDFERKYKNQT